MPAEEQVCVLYAGVKGYLDKINTSDIGKFEKMYLETIHSKHSGLLETIRSEGALSPQTDAQIASVLNEFLPTCGLAMKS